MGATPGARVYVIEVGRWEWVSTSANDALLDQQSGSFVAAGSNLRGLLRKHRENPRAWMTDDGRGFANISDTGYRLFHAQAAPLWRDFIRDSAAKGITCMRVTSLGGWGGTPNARVDDNTTWVWNDPWAGGAAPEIEGDTPEARAESFLALLGEMGLVEFLPDQPATQPDPVREATGDAGRARAAAQRCGRQLPFAIPIRCRVS